MEQDKTEMNLGAREEDMDETLHANAEQSKPQLNAGDKSDCGCDATQRFDKENFKDYDSRASS